MGRTSDLREQMIVDTSIIYLIVVPGDAITEATVMQGFSQSLLECSPLIDQISYLPSDVYDLTDKGRHVLVERRIAGIAPVRWYPISPRALRSHPHSARTPFCFVVLPPSESPRAYEEWLASSPTRPMLVAGAGADLTYAELTPDGIKRHLLDACDRIPSDIDPASVAEARTAIQQWRHPPSRRLPYQVGGHNTIAPNVAALTVAGFDDILYGRFDKQRPGKLRPYTEQIERTTNSILEERDRIGEKYLNRIHRQTLDLNIFAPGIYPHFLSIAPPDEMSHEQKAQFRTGIAALRNQTGYSFEVTEAQGAVLFGEEFTRSGFKAKPEISPFIFHRTQENFLSTAILSAFAASEFSAVIRLPNDINRTAGVVRSFAEHYRSDRATPRKRLESFRKVQRRIGEAVPEEFLHLIRRSRTGIRILADAHIEWLDVDGLPLVLSKDCSRVAVTPGNLFVAQLSAVPPIHFKPDALTNVLVLSALPNDDPIRRMFEIAFREFSKQWGDRMQIRAVEIANKRDLVSALNSFEGNIVVFDGHGSHEKDDTGKLHLKEEAIDVWSLRDENVRIPPIVILSACDTHAADRNHATTANGFMLLGARTVLSSVFPLDARFAASFVARLLYRIAEFVPAAIRMRQKAVTWLEVVSGMIRMQLLTDFLMQLLTKKKITEGQYRQAHYAGNMAINSFQPTPFDHVLETLENIGLLRDNLEYELQLAVAFSSAISYLQVGRPETILIDDHARVRAQLEELSAFTKRAGDKDTE